MAEAIAKTVTNPTDILPIREILEPEDHDQAAAFIRDCAATETPIYPIGGGTSLSLGLPPRSEGVGLSLDKLKDVVDYPARDMTITVAAGVTMRQLATTLAAERQRLPVDVPQRSAATLGGVVATNFNGCLRYGHGNVRDHIIGIQAVDGRGMTFRGGGRVVKNVAGYDFCKLLTGSLGTLGVITQVTLKLKPIPPDRALLVCRPRDLNEAERLLAALGDSRVAPVAVELLGGPGWQQEYREAGLPEGDPLLLAVVCEGSHTEVEWMIPQLESEWRELGVATDAVLRGDQLEPVMDSLAEFPAREAPLVVKASVVPSYTTKLIAAAREIDAACTFQSHAGSGVVIVRFPTFPEAGLSRTVVTRLQPAAVAGSGSLVILANPSGTELTRRSVWGTSNAPYQLMKRVKQEFDPHDLLNRGRFVYE